jgi:apolipoprotein D and lipocalin family protein
MAGGALPVCSSDVTRRNIDTTIERNTDMTKLQIAGLIVLLLAVAGLAAAVSARSKDQIPPVANVDLPRFMGDWYVIAHIPTFVERDSFDAIETYAMGKEGEILTTFKQRKGSHDAPLKEMNPVGTVREGTNNAIWGMQFIWPIKAEYVIVYLDEDYTQTIVGRSARDYVWIMARTPSISDADYAAHLDRLRALGYDLSKLRKVPQKAAETATTSGTP